MSRDIRLVDRSEHFHVFDHACGRGDLFLDDRDRRAYLFLLGREVLRRGWSCPCYCLMDNHLHLVVGPRDGELSGGMKAIKAGYAFHFNRRYRRRGPVFAGRFGSPMLVDEKYFLEVCRYVVLNPVRAGLVRAPGDWPWSSFRATAGRERKPEWLDADAVLASVAGMGPTPRQAYSWFVGTGLLERPFDFGKLNPRRG
jgi:REP element-mobilizing transposase RayT